MAPGFSSRNGWPHFGGGRVATDASHCILAAQTKEEAVAASEPILVTGAAGFIVRLVNRTTMS